MGEIADMMLDGSLCEACGAFIGESDGFPRYCSTACSRDRGQPERPTAKKRRHPGRRK